MKNTKSSLSRFLPNAIAGYYARSRTRHLRRLRNLITMRTLALSEQTDIIKREFKAIVEAHRKGTIDRSEADRLTQALKDYSNRSIDEYAELRFDIFSFNIKIVYRNLLITRSPLDSLKSHVIVSLLDSAITKRSAYISYKVLNEKKVDTAISVSLFLTGILVNFLLSSNESQIYLVTSIGLIALSLVTLNYALAYYRNRLGYYGCNHMEAREIAAAIIRTQDKGGFGDGGHHVKGALRPADERNTSSVPSHEPIPGALPQ